MHRKDTTQYKVQGYSGSHGTFIDPSHEYPSHKNPNSIIVTMQTGGPGTKPLELHTA